MSKYQKRHLAAVVFYMLFSSTLIICSITLIQELRAFKLPRDEIEIPIYGEITALPKESEERGDCGINVLAETVDTIPEWQRDDVPLSAELQNVIYNACAANDIDYALALGLIDGESSFDVNAGEGELCYGLCQLNKKYFPADLTPEENVTDGIEYLAYQIDRYDGDIAAGLTAYNAGHDTGSREYANYILGKAKIYGYGGGRINHAA